MSERYHRRDAESPGGARPLRPAAVSSDGGRVGVPILDGCDSRRWPISNRQDDREVQFRELSGRLELDYPVLWVYKVIGTDEAALRAAVLEVVSADDEVTLELSNRSSGGTYVSLNVEVQVVDESHRKGLYRSLREHPEVRMVL